MGIVVLISVQASQHELVCIGELYSFRSSSAIEQPLF